jgi:hypothetical protein
VLIERIGRLTRTTSQSPEVSRLAIILSALLLAAPSAAAALDASPWERVLAAHAKADGFDYAALKADRARLSDLRQFLESVAEMDEDEPLSAWLNAYNAIVVSEVVEHYPLRSVRDVEGFFDTERHRVAGRRRTLDQLEHRVIRPRFRDARVHFALNCGSVSCPPLHRHAFRERILDATLDRLVRQALSSRRHARVSGRVVHLTELFFWFDEDFERDAGSVVAWLKAHGGERFANVPADAELRRISWDWRLNDGD